MLQKEHHVFSQKSQRGCIESAPEITHHHEAEFSQNTVYDGTSVSFQCLWLLVSIRYRG